jgi:hypothetical protein
MKPKQEIVQVSAHKYVTLLRGALERAYRGLGRAEAVAQESHDIEWQTDLRAMRLVLKIGADAHLADINRDTNLNRPQKFTPERYRAAYQASKTGTVSDVAEKMGVARTKLSEWLTAHPELRLPRKK